MRIGVDALMLHRLASGVEQATLQLLAALDAYGRECYHVYVPSGMTDVCPAKRAGLHPCPLHPGQRFRRILYEQALLPGRCRRDQLDLLHCPGYVAPISQPRLPKVITVHDLIALDHPRLCKRTNVLHYRFMLPASMRRATGIVVPSQTTRREITGRYPEYDEKITVIPHGVDKKFFQPVTAEERDNVRKRYSLPAGPFILFVGQIEPKKNTTGLVEAFHQLVQKGSIGKHHLVLAGGIGWGVEHLHSRIAELGLTNRITFTGFVCDADLPALFQSARLFVFPSLYEGFGLPPLEAMAAEVPCIVSDGGALPEIAGPGAAVINAGSKTELAERMHQLLEDQQEREKLVEAGRKRAQQFTWKDAAEKTETFYRKLCNLT